MNPVIFVSAIVCGIGWAGAYPFFLPPGAISSRDSARMRGLPARGLRYLAVAAAVPLVGVAVATFIPSGEIETAIGAIRALCAGGIAAFIGVYWLFHTLAADLLALERATSNECEPIVET